MADDNAMKNINEQNEENDLEEFNLSELEDILSKQLEEELTEFSFLEVEKDKVGNPDALGEVILNEVWKQFSNQVGLDITNETTIQKYDREHPESYAEVSKKVMQDKEYKDVRKKMVAIQKEGKLVDAYTGKTMHRNKNMNVDHTVPRKKIYENLRRKQANLSTEELANKKENLRATSEALNKSKGSKSVKEYIGSRSEREQSLRIQNEKANQKTDKKPISDLEKKLEKQKREEKLQDKIDADNDLMSGADKVARKAINADIAKGAVKEVGKKAGKDALKTMAITALFEMLKEIMNGLIRFLKSKSKSFKKLLDEMKASIKSFFNKMSNVLSNGVSTLFGTVVSEIFGPIVSMFKKLASLIKQGVGSIVEAIRYLKNKENKNEPFSIKVAEVGKIITLGLIGGSAISLGEVFEKVLMTVPGMQVELPLIGSLANVIGLFLSSLISGLMGAIIMNLIDKYIAKKQKKELQKAKIEKGNQVIFLQHNLLGINQEMLSAQKIDSISSIKKRHASSAEVMKKSLQNIYDVQFEETQQAINENMDEMDDLLSELLEEGSEY